MWPQVWELPAGMVARPGGLWPDEGQQPIVFCTTLCCLLSRLALLVTWWSPPPTCDMGRSL